MSKERELLKRVRDTLRELKETHYTLYWDIQSILDQPEQEPVACMEDIWNIFNGVFIGTTIQKSLAQELIIKAHHAGVKAAKNREPLSYEHLEALVDTHHGYPMTLGRAIEEAHGIGGGNE